MNDPARRHVWPSTVADTAGQRAFIFAAFAFSSCHRLDVLQADDGSDGAHDCPASTDNYTPAHITENTVQMWRASAA